MYLNFTQPQDYYNYKRQSYVAQDFFPVLRLIFIVTLLSADVKMHEATFDF